MDEVTDKSWAVRITKNGSKETHQAFAAFCVYRDMPTGSRSIRAAAALHTDKKRAGDWLNWSARWDWVRRAEEYDAWKAALEMDAQERAAEAKAAEWQERREQQREEEWELRKKLYEKVNKMLDFPLSVTRIKGDGDKPDMVVMPARWSYKEVVQAVEAISKIGRLAASMETDRRAVSGTVSGAVGVDVSGEVELKSSEIAQRVINDPVASHMAHELLARIAEGG